MADDVIVNNGSLKELHQNFVVDEKGLGVYCIIGEMRKTTDLQLKLLGIVPRLKDQTGVLEPEEIVALSALLTFKGKSVRTLLKEIKESEKDFDKTIRNVLLNSSLRGHASMATTPTLAVTWEGSKFLDLLLTGIVFASGLMASGRRTGTTNEDIIYPTSISQNKEAKKLYTLTSKENIGFFNDLLGKGIEKDEARKILQYGLVGVGTMTLPIESIIGFKKEYENEKAWMPEEAGLFLKEIEANLKNLGVDLLYPTRLAAPRDVYPYANIFKNPRQTNLARDLAQKYRLDNLTEIVSFSANLTPGLKKRTLELWRKTRSMVEKKRIQKDWLKILDLRRKIARDYNLAIEAQVFSTVAWCVWTEKKRHRTCFLIADSLYYSADRAGQVLRKFSSAIKRERLTAKGVEVINRVFSVPPIIRKKFLFGYLNRALESFNTYQALIELGIPVSDAIFVIPRGLRIDVLQRYNLYNLISGYYPLRLCTTADEQIQRLTEKEVVKIKKILKEKNLGWLAKQIVPKCHLCGFCSEKNFCAKIKSLVPDYNETFHQKMHRSLGKLAEIGS
jgi:hypothetical protein